MSNCHLVAVRSLSDLAASRLALRAPALRGGYGLDSAQSITQRLSCGRHAVSTAVAIDPVDVVDCAPREYLRNPSLLMLFGLPCWSIRPISQLPRARCATYRTPPVQWDCRFNSSRLARGARSRRPSPSSCATW